MTWQPIDTAPRDGRPIQARIKGERKPRVISWEVIEGGNEDGTGWVFGWMIDPSDPNEDSPPASWDDGYCWAINSDDEPSAQPTHWMPLDA